jgi:hypothetical protein
LRHIAGNETCIDGADRRADDPVRLDSGFVQRLIDTGLKEPSAPPPCNTSTTWPGSALPCDLILSKGSLP